MPPSSATGPTRRPTSPIPTTSPRRPRRNRRPDGLGHVGDRFPELDRSKAEADAARADRPDLSTLTDAELVAYARSFVPAVRRLFDDHVITSSNTAVGPTVLAQVTGAIDPGLMLRMIASSGDVDSALPSYAMWHLSREANASAEVTAAFDAGVGGLLDRVRAGGSGTAAWLAHFEAFLVDYGFARPQRVGPVLRQLGDPPRAGIGPHRPHAGRRRRREPAPTARTRHRRS